MGGTGVHFFIAAPAARTEEKFADSLWFLIA